MAEAITYEDALVVPDAFRRILLPSPHMSISSVLGIRLPPPLNTPVRQNIQPVELFVTPPGDYSPTHIDLQQLRAIPIPSADTLELATMHAEYHFRAGRSMIQCVHIIPEDSSATMPIVPVWVLVYWLEVYDHMLRLPVWQKVQSVTDQLATSNSSLDQGLAVRVRNALHNLPYKSGKLSPFASPDQIAELCNLTQWLSTTHGDGLLDVLRDNSRLPPHVSILDIHYLQFAHQYREAPTEAPDWLQKCAAKAVEDGQTLASIIWHQSHFTAVIVDVPASKSFFGNSLHGAMPQEYVTAIDSMIRIARTAVSCTHETFTVEDLEIGNQLDAHNCLIFAVNALCMDFIEGTKLASDEISCSRARVSAFCDIVEHLASEVRSAMEYELTIVLKARKNGPLSGNHCSTSLHPPRPLPAHPVNKKARTATAVGPDSAMNASVLWSAPAPDVPKVGPVAKDVKAKVIGVHLS
jgi:hypothetical protein